jgi:phosphate-transporting ATPase
VLTLRGLERAGLEPVDLDLAPGACIAVGGPSGAGKTLMLRAIADLDPHDGTVALDGVASEAMPAPVWRRRVTYVPAEAGWWAEAVSGHYEDWPAAAALAERLGLPAACGDWPITRLSTGEKQRLALIRALLGSPDVLLLDEPTSGLDPEATAAVEALLRERLAAGLALLLVTHDAALADRLGDRRYRLDAGRLEAA